MAVIGKLDGQVDAVLIAPLAKKDEPERPVRVAHPREDPTRAHTASQTANDVEHAEKAAERQELPIRLL